MAKHTTPAIASTSPDIKSKTKFAGIDFHKKFAVVTFEDEQGTVLSQTKVLCDEPSVVSCFSQFTDLSCAIENCRANEWFVELLKELGCTVFVANTYAVKLITESHRKTDKIDSRILMQLLAKGFLPLCYQPTREERILKERLKYRIHLMNSRTQYINKTHAILDKENHGSKLRSRKRRLNVDVEQLSIERQFLFNRYCQIIDHFESAITAEDHWVKQTIKASDDAIRLKTAPGVGDITALTLIAEIGDVSRFKRACSVSAYFGLVPSLYSSSDVRRLGAITKRGSKNTRRVLIQAAWVAIKKCPELRHKYSVIMRRRGKKIAIIAIARKLVEICYRILKDKTVFDPTQLTLG